MWSVTNPQAVLPAVPGLFVPPPGLTMWLNDRSFQQDGPAAANTPLNVVNWFDLSGTLAAAFTQGTQAQQPTVGNGISGRRSVQFSSSGPSNLKNGTDTQVKLFSASAFTIACACIYTGGKNYTAASPQATPALLTNQNGLSPQHGVGLMIGQDSGTPTNCIIGAWLTDATPAVHVVTGPSLPKSSAHYAIVTFSGGVLTIQVDTQAAVSISGIGNVGDLTALLEIGTNAISVNAELDGSIGEEMTWARALNAAEISSVQSYFAEKWGVPPPGIAN